MYKKVNEIDRIEYVLANISELSISQMAKNLGISKQALHQYVISHQDLISTEKILKQLSIGREIWKPLYYNDCEYKGYYISDYGRVFCERTRKLLKLYDGIYVKVYKKTKIVPILIDVAVSDTFYTKLDFTELIDRLMAYPMHFRALLLGNKRKQYAKLYVKHCALPNETWKGMTYLINDIFSDYSDLYYISTKGRIFSIRWCEFVKVTDTTVPHFRFQTENNPVNILVNRAVAQNFIPNPNNYACVRFKTADRKDCSVDNLEWCDLEQAIKKYHKYIKK